MMITMTRSDTLVRRLSKLIDDSNDESMAKAKTMELNMDMEMELDLTQPDGPAVVPEEPMHEVLPLVTTPTEEEVEDKVLVDIDNQDDDDDDDNDSVSERTRAKVSLEEVAIEDLEAMLPLTQEEEGEEEDVVMADSPKPQNKKSHRRRRRRTSAGTRASPAFHTRSKHHVVTTRAMQPLVRAFSLETAGFFVPKTATAAAAAAVSTPVKAAPKKEKKAVKRSTKKKQPRPTVNKNQLSYEMKVLQAIDKLKDRLGASWRALHRMVVESRAGLLRAAIRRALVHGYIRRASKNSQRFHLTPKGRLQLLEQ